MTRRAWGYVVAVAAVATAADSAQQPSSARVDSLYALEATSISGEPVHLAAFAGKVTLVVNTASQCGFTPQYKDLQQLHTELAPRGFAVLAFPSNDFGNQEPSDEADIKTFCERTYGVAFPMFAKVVTKPGPAQSPIYAYLGRSGHLPKWNFSKYLVGRDGRVLAFFPSHVTPRSPELRQAIEGALAG